jgi:hypothetical protein
MTTLLAMEQNEPISALEISQLYPQKECLPNRVLMMLLPASTFEEGGIIELEMEQPRIFFMIFDQ